jgi:hypothetical protein
MKLQSFTFGSTTIPSNTTVYGRIKLETVATVNRRVMLSTSSSDLKIQKYVDVPAGQTQVDVPVVAKVLEINKAYTVTAQLEHVTVKVKLEAVPSQLASLIFNPPDVESQGSTSMTIILNNVAEQGGANILLSEYNTVPGNQLLVPTLPVSLLIDEGETTTTIDLTVARVYNDEATRITATYNGAAVSQWLYIQGENPTR